MTGISLNTGRLNLVAGSAELVQVEINDPLQLSQLLEARVPESWPPTLFTLDLLKYVAQQLDQDSSLMGWLHWYWILRDKTNEQRVLIGVSGFSQPSPDGTVEIAYSILKEFQGFGYATEAVAGLLPWVFSHPEIRRVIAEVLPEKIPSIHLLETNGFKALGEGIEHGVIVDWFELTREMYQGGQSA
jgi:RimJ/RimL family protein N-acetyltransferase